MHATPASIPDPKAMAKALRAALAARGIDIAHGAALEIVAAQHGLASWNVLAARTKDAGGLSSPPDAVRLGPACPILRIFDEEQARAIDLAFLGFALDWEHRFGSQFVAEAYVNQLAAVGALPSMSRTRPCQDDAPPASVLHTLNVEPAHHHRRATRSEARRDLLGPRRRPPQSRPHPLHPQASLPQTGHTRGTPNPRPPGQGTIRGGSCRRAVGCKGGVWRPGPGFCS